MILAACGFLLLAAGLIFVRSRQALPASPALPADTSQVPRITLQQAKQAFDAGSAVFVDARAADAFSQSHIPGALSLPLAQVPASLGDLDPHAWIITYCT
jgi:3-mercaptopyruvate sulfurtransferase SseA